jgi:hypothetical protein
VDLDLSAAFRELRDEWLQLSRDYATLAARPYDAVAAEAHLENLRRHRERLRFLRSSLRRFPGEPDIH